jgi:thiol-disulfide isomerase/thioredoxin
MRRSHCRLLAALLLASSTACAPRDTPASAGAAPPRTIVLTPPESSASPDPDQTPPTEPLPQDVEPSELAFSLPALNSDSTAGLRPGVVNIVAFGASWCAPCKPLYSSLDSLYRSEKAWLSVVILQEDDDRGSAAQSVLGLGLQAPAAWDEGGTVAHQWKLETMPAIFIVDRKGRIRFRHDGYSPDDDATLAREARSLEAER